MIQIESIWLHTRKSYISQARGIIQQYLKHTMPLNTPVHITVNGRMFFQWASSHCPCISKLGVSVWCNLTNCTSGCSLLSTTFDYVCTCSTIYSICDTCKVITWLATARLCLLRKHLLTQVIPSSPVLSYFLLPGWWNDLSPPVLPIYSKYPTNHKTVSFMQCCFGEHLMAFPHFL